MIKVPVNHIYIDAIHHRCQHNQQHIKNIAVVRKPRLTKKQKNTPAECNKYTNYLMCFGFGMKKTAPMMITNIGVNEFSVPARELSIPCSAMQNKYAGNKLPNTPDMKVKKILFPGICLKLL